jgi:thymidylate synthase ThyX
MGYAARILADSENVTRNRLTTFEITFPRIVLAEFNTHRMFSRNSASSRAIPVEKQIERVITDPFVPERFPRNGKGMQEHGFLEGATETHARDSWLLAREEAVASARQMLQHGVHKQITNRLLEPWMWHTVICSGTEFANFFALRCHPDAQPEIRKVAEMMRDLYEHSEPLVLMPGEWHLPLVTHEERIEFGEAPAEHLAKISAGRCARVSYLTHDGRRAPDEDVALCERLTASGHMSPLEHPAMALPDFRAEGNFRGFRQLRKTIPGEDVFRPAVQP